MEQKTVRIPNISCGHCTATITRELEDLNGIKSVQADVDTREVTIKWEPPALWSDIANMLDEIAYPAEG